MTSFITIPYKIERVAPPFEGNDIKSPESLVRHFVGKYSRAGAKVFDPFAGLGTTLFVAEEMKRTPFGIEADPQRHEWVAGQLTHWTHLCHADSARMASLRLPKMDFCYTSPPFMSVTQKWNPLRAGNPKYAGYKNYLKRMEHIFAQMPRVMKKGATVVVQVNNIEGKPFTPLVRDIGAAVAKSLQPVGEVIAAFKGGPKDWPHAHCLIFTSKG